eukprot:TRINITY_DN19128_c0_g2_i1.p1 TRINITY_DN19128_c0_g2~~TRINITY_DN19128_c0_g2_i1.p1  ORF type:complete len:147 (+),score=27.92 TRINITY_DN19128_c0_g2_i1:131-571(+)
MAANSLRGGKNVYSHQSLLSNWVEERLEPKHHQATLDTLHQLPSASAKTWKKTSEEVGAHSQEAMSKKVTTFDSDNFISYQNTGPDHYQTSQRLSHGNPQEYVPDDKDPKFTEEQLKEYRATWTTGDGHRFMTTTGSALAEGVAKK